MVTLNAMCDKESKLLCNKIAHILHSLRKHAEDRIFAQIANFHAFVAGRFRAQFFLSKKWAISCAVLFEMQSIFYRRMLVCFEISFYRFVFYVMNLSIYEWWIRHRFARLIKCEFCALALSVAWHNWVDGYCSTF